MPPRAKVDAYGKPLVPLVDAGAENLFTSATNAEQRALLWIRLEALLKEVCQRNFYGEISFQISIKDGVIMEHMIERLRRYR
jgi:hypothetical protein